MSDMKIIIEGSGKHCHLTKETFAVLFGEGAELDVKKMLSQPGQFASSCKITVVGPKGETKMSVLGPFRSADQVELSFTDARGLGLDCPIRMSGDLKGSAPCKLVGPAGSVELSEGAIVALRHCHISPEDGEKWGIKTGDRVMVKCGEGGGRALIFDDVVARIGPDHATYMHVDYDEINAAALFGKDPVGEIIKK